MSVGVSSTRARLPGRRATAGERDSTDESPQRRAASRPSSAALTPPPGNPRFPLFDGLRAIAAVSVLLYHAGFYARANEGQAGLSPYLARLNVGVAVFFVISGFLLYRPLLLARIGRSPSVRLRDYVRRRILRIVPAYWVAITVLAVYPGLPGIPGGHWWVYYAFAQDYSVHRITLGIGPAWSLGCEVVFYLSLPFLSALLAWGARRRRRAVWWQLELGLLATLGAASAGWRIYAHYHTGIPSSTFASTLAWFALGMALALASVRAGGGPALARYAWGGWLVAAAAYLVICRGLGLGGGFVFFERQSVAQDLAVYALSGVVAAGLALPAVFESDFRRGIGRVLASPVLAWLGLVSYGIYLYHQPIAQALNGGVNRGGNATERFLWLAAATAVLSVSAGALSYYLIERPALRFKDRRRMASLRGETAEAGAADAPLAAGNGPDPR